MKKEHKENDAHSEDTVRRSEQTLYPDRKNDQKTRNLAGALILIIIGTLFLLNNFGLLPWSVWRDLWRFWPLFLIFWGFQMIFGKSKIANTILLLISVMVLGYFILNTIANNNPQFNESLKQNFPLWQNLYHYNPPPEDSSDEEESPLNRRRGLQRPFAPQPQIDFGDEEQIPFELP